MAAEQELQKMALEIRVLQERAGELQRQAATFKAMLEETRNAFKALSALAGSGAGESGSASAPLFPVGGGAMVEAKPVDSGKVLFEVGAGVVLRKPASEVAKILEERGEKLLQAISAVEGELEQAAERMEEIREAAGKLQQK